MMSNNPVKDAERHYSDMEDAPHINCIKCGEGIFEGEYYYDLDGQAWCETCLDNEFGRRWSEDDSL